VEGDDGGRFVHILEKVPGIKLYLVCIKQESILSREHRL